MLEERVQEVRSLTKSFRNAFRGIAFCVRNERNMRIHLTVSAYVLVFSTFYNLSSLEYIALLICIGMVLCAEALNTSIEAVIDLQTQCYDNLARIAKDVAAGAVFISAFFAACIGFLLFLKINVIIYIINFLALHIVWGGLFLLSLPLSVYFIFNFPPKRKWKK